MLIYTSSILPSSEVLPVTVVLNGPSPTKVNALIDNFVRPNSHHVAIAFAYFFFSYHYFNIFSPKFVAPEPIFTY